MTTDPLITKVIGHDNSPSQNYEVLRDGLLWKINHDILHPLGLALSVETDRGDLAILVADDGVWTYPPGLDAEFAAKWLTWVECARSGKFDLSGVLDR
jgi:hypothetical protein